MKQFQPQHPPSRKKNEKQKENKNEEKWYHLCIKKPKSITVSEKNSNYSLQRKKVQFNA